MTNKLLDACKVMNGLFNESIKTTLTCTSHLASMCCFLKCFAFKTSQTNYFNSHFYTTGAPRLVVVTAVNSTSVVLSWSEVQCFSGSGAVTHYLVQYHSSCCGGGTVQNVTTDGLVQVISGLTPNTVYTFRVAAVGAGQNIGPFSNPTNTSLPG